MGDDLTEETKYQRRTVKLNKPFRARHKCDTQKDKTTPIIGVADSGLHQKFQT